MFQGGQAAKIFRPDLKLFFVDFSLESIHLLDHAIKDQAHEVLLTAMRFRKFSWIRPPLPLITAMRQHHSQPMSSCPTSSDHLRNVWRKTFPLSTRQWRSERENVFLMLRNCSAKAANMSNLHSLILPRIQSLSSSNRNISVPSGRNIWEKSEAVPWRSRRMT